MRKFSLILFCLTACFLSVELGWGQPPPIIPGAPGVTWQMSPGQVQQVAPGAYVGTIGIYQGTFTGDYAALYYFHFYGQQRQEHLKFVTVNPAYTYQDPSLFVGDYRNIVTNLTDIYGQPVTKTSERVVFEPPGSRVSISSYTTGWAGRIEPR